MIKTDTALMSQIASLFPDNIAREISEEDLRTMFQDMVDSKLNANQRSAANGVAALDGNSKVPLTQLAEATTEAKGIVQLAENNETSSDKAVKSDDPRLVNPFVNEASVVGLDGTEDFDVSGYTAGVKHITKIASLDNNCTISFSNASELAGRILELHVVLTNNSAVLSFDSGINWYSAAPAISGSADLVATIQFRYINGGLWANMIS